MMKSWSANPEDRSTFKELFQSLNAMSNSNDSQPIQAAQPKEYTEELLYN
jgi:hypothetical protein